MNPHVGRSNIAVPSIYKEVHGSSNFLALRQEKRVSITESSFGKLEIGVVLHFSYGSNPICTVSNSMPGMMRFRTELNRDYAGPADWCYIWLGTIFNFKKQYYQKKGG
jgi:hypothetical protein